MFTTFYIIFIKNIAVSVCVPSNCKFSKEYLIPIVIIKKVEQKGYQKSVNTCGGY